MKNIIIAFIFIFAFNCNGQDNFESLIAKFPQIQLPIDSVQLVTEKDTLDVKTFNYFFWESQPKEEKNGKAQTVKPKIYKDGNIIELTDFGKANERPMNYRTIDGKKGKFYSKIYPIGSLNLNKNFISLLVKEYDSQLAHYDLYIFSKDGKRLSAIPMFTYEHNSMFEDKIDYVITKSTILKDGTIRWEENNRGLKTTRTYKLREDGYFEITAEEKTGKFEY